jgi:hypothetical protein
MDRRFREPPDPLQSMQTLESLKENYIKKGGIKKTEVTEFLDRGVRCTRIIK